MRDQTSFALGCSAGAEALIDAVPGAVELPDGPFTGPDAGCPASCPIVQPLSTTTVTAMVLSVRDAGNAVVLSGRRGTAQLPIASVMDVAPLGALMP